MPIIKKLFGSKKTPTIDVTTPVEAARLDDVFPLASHIVKYSYVSRPHVEKEVQSCLRRANALIFFSGPSKSGKTVLASRLSGDLPKAHLHVWRSMTVDEFWQALRAAIDAPNTMEEAESLQIRTDNSATSESSIGIPLGAGALNFKQERLQNTGRDQLKEKRQSIELPGRVGVIEHLKKNPHTIIIDDYHWMNTAILSDIFPPLKQALGIGSKVILISVSNNVFPTTGDLGDFAGRTLSVQMPPWTMEEIQEIGTLGFKTLNVDVSSASILNLQKRSYFSPLLMQGLCNTWCYEHQILSRSSDVRSLPELTVAEAGKLASRLAKPQTSGFEPVLGEIGEKKYRTKAKDGRTLTLTEVFLNGISHTRPFEPYTIDNLVKRVKEHVLDKGKIYETLGVARTECDAELRKLLKGKAADIERRLGGERGDRSPIFYDKVAEAITIVDPYFKAWVRWVKGPELSGNLFEN